MITTINSVSIYHLTHLKYFSGDKNFKLCDFQFSVETIIIIIIASRISETNIFSLSFLT